MSAPAEPSVTDVEAAAERIVDAFAANDGPRYFAGFAPEATFIFHPEPQRLPSRDAYEQLWNSWRADGWRVVSCTSTDRHVQTFAGARSSRTPSTPPSRPHRAQSPTVSARPSSSRCRTADCSPFTSTSQPTMPERRAGAAA
ncbi:nuclear transport factor 2 family protein [Nesterenkonia pannonica]|uniref:YybH family protein n=1 Tax=Nesterenkonia pannonica TaxID=1548602 RepID=UPI0021641D08|nr:nuclear transport factor 2 family protein [Nesterenkonia pannonica]